MIQRLHLPNDEPLLREAYRWDGERGAWFQAMDKVFNRGTEDDFVQGVNQSRAYIGVFDPSLIGLLIIEMHAPGYHEAHLCAKRGANVITLTIAFVTVISDLFSLGLIHGWVWIAEKNIPVRRICDRIGMCRDGVVQWRGSYRGRVIKWERYSIRREWLALEEAA